MCWQNENVFFFFDAPCDVNELWAERAHALDTVEQVLEAL
jgi:hypothetical protein